jgi:hypothetical protein
MASTHAHDDEHGVPKRTTPQGTQEHGVEHGHEERDVNFGALGYWFTVLAMTVALAYVVVWGFYAVVKSQARSAQVLPSELFANRQAPPEPRIMPNPKDSGANPMTMVQQYPETIPQHREREAQEMAKYGLLNPETKEPQLPEAAAARVIAAAGGPVPAGGGAAGSAPAPAGGAGAGQAAEASEPTAGVQQLTPSGSSGGTRLENRLAGE